MHNIILHAKPENHNGIFSRFKKEIRKSKHFEGFKTPIEAVYKRVCATLGLHFVHWDNQKRTLTIAEN